MKPVKARRSLLKCVNCQKCEWTLMQVQLGFKKAHQFLLVCDYCLSEYKFER